MSRDVAGTKWRAAGEVSCLSPLTSYRYRRPCERTGWKHQWRQPIQCWNVGAIHGTVIMDTSVSADCRSVCTNVSVWRWQRSTWRQHETVALRDGGCEGCLSFGIWRAVGLYMCVCMCVGTFRKNLLPSSEMSVHMYETVRRHSDLYMPWSELTPFRRTDLRGGLIDSSARVCEYSGWRAAVITWDCVSGVRNRFTRSGRRLLLNLKTYALSVGTLKHIAQRHSIVLIRVSCSLPWIMGHMVAQSVEALR